MSVKLVKLRAALAALTLLAMAGACSPEPLTPEQEQRISRIYLDMPERQRIGIQQNLRFAGLYSGDLDTDWPDTLGEAINTAHFELDLIDGNYPIDTDAGVASFLTALAGPEIRKRLRYELSTDLPQWVQISPAATEAEIVDNGCRVDGGVYERNGETIGLVFYRTRAGAGVDFGWTGWPGAPLSPLFIVKYGEETWAMPGSVEQRDAVVNASLYNVNGSHIVSAIQRSTSITISGSSLTEPIEIPTGDLYQTGASLADCYSANFGG
jgi:hypothetical protein